MSGNSFDQRIGVTVLLKNGPMLYTAEISLTQASDMVRGNAMVWCSDFCVTNREDILFMVKGKIEQPQQPKIVTPQGLSALRS